MRLGPRAGLCLAVLLPLLLAGGASGQGIPYREYESQCYWWERVSPGGLISYDEVSHIPRAEEGIQNWHFAMAGRMGFYWQTYPFGHTHLTWEGEWPGQIYCDLPEAFACWDVAPGGCAGTKLWEAAIYFDQVNYPGLVLDDEKIAVSAHEWGHNLNLGHIPNRYFCTAPPRIMAEWGPDGVGCITGPTPQEVRAVVHFYTDTHGDGIRDFEDPTPEHDVGVKLCMTFGPAPVNISDFARYMWVICEVGNFSNHEETVTLDLSVNGAPVGCDQMQDLILPGTPLVLLYEPYDDDGDTVADEDPIDGFDNDMDTLVDEDPPMGGQRWVLYRVRYECHAPAVSGVSTLTVTFSIDHVDPGGHGDETAAAEANNTRIQNKSFVVGSY